MSQKKAPTTVDTLKDALSRYESLVPADLNSLDRLRYVDIPAAIAGREPYPYLERRELVQLVEWKVKHGKFRPKLVTLAGSNSEDDVRIVTQTAFEELRDGENREEGLTAPGLLPGLQALLSLRGIGPATASLVLSCGDPKFGIPFFSDGLFRLARWDGVGDGIKSARKHGEWTRPIDYTMMEYFSLTSRVREMRAALKKHEVDMSVFELEKAAWVMMKEKIDGGGVMKKLVDTDEAGGVAQTEKTKSRLQDDDDEDGTPSDSPPFKKTTSSGAFKTAESKEQAESHRNTRKSDDDDEDGTAPDSPPFKKTKSSGAFKTA